MQGLWRRGTPVDVLVVCTGNVCRSPYVAARLRAGVPRLQVAAAGTGALVGCPPTPQVGALLARHGVTGTQPTARLLTRRDVRAAALVLTAEGAHRARVAQLVPGAADRTFTIRELARLLGATDATDAVGVDAVLQRATAALELDGREHPDDLIDPYGGDDAAYELMAEMADAALAVLLPALGAGR